MEGVMGEQIKRYAMPFFPNGTLAEPQEVERGSWMQYADYARDIKALRKRERYWRHFTWLYRERLMCEESTTTEQAATIETLQDLLCEWMKDIDTDLSAMPIVRLCEKTAAALKARDM